MISPDMSARFPSGNCSEVRARLYEILEGQVAPNELAMNTGFQLEWTRVLTHKCSISPEVDLSPKKFVFTVAFRSNIADNPGHLI